MPLNTHFIYWFFTHTRWDCLSIQLRSAWLFWNKICLKLMGVSLWLVWLSAWLLCRFELFSYEYVGFFLRFLFCLGMPSPWLLIFRFFVCDQAIIDHSSLIVLCRLSNNPLALFIFYRSTGLNIRMEILLSFLLLDSLP
jgi:hypothetical protein